VMQRSLEEEAAFLSEIQGGLIHLGMFAALAALIAGFMVSERITRPVRRLVRGAEEMERGNYEYPLGKSSRDEIGYLAERFREMRHHERRYVSSLQEVARLKSEFMSVASHELRTPISVIKGFHELLESGELGPLTPKQEQALSAIAKSIDGLENIAENATRVAQIEGGRIALDADDHEVAKLLKNAIELATADARGRDVHLHLEIEPGLGSAWVDGSRMTQAVANLVRNGIRFTPDGGEVVVGAWREHEELVIEVKDTGVGIPEEKLAGLFGKSVIVRDSLNHHSSNTLEFNSAGLGLGLSIAGGFVEAHGGRIEVKSKPGEGSTFTIRLPGAREGRLNAAA